jgi:hypothetical protein
LCPAQAAQERLAGLFALKPAGAVDLEGFGLVQAWFLTRPAKNSSYLSLFCALDGFQLACEPILTIPRTALILATLTN